MISRRHFLWSLAGLGLGSSYVRFFESGWFETTHRTIPLPERILRRPVRILHLSDFHLSPDVSLALIEDGISLGLREKPDLICLTGDFITRRLHDAAKYRAILRQLPDTAPTFACLGNHDGGNWVGCRGGYEDGATITGFLSECGIPVLRDSSQTISVSHQSLRLVGLTDYWSGPIDLERAFRPNPDPCPVLVLAHNPDVKTLIRSRPWDLMLSGHTHGGQIVLPILGAPFAPVTDTRFVSGLHTWNGRHIFVTRGVGNVHGVRFNCRPEVSILELAPDSKQAVQPGPPPKSAA